MDREAGEDSRSESPRNARTVCFLGLYEVLNLRTESRRVGAILSDLMALLLLSLILLITSSWTHSSSYNGLPMDSQWTPNGLPANNT